jgi:hypothetical protein
MSASDLNNKPTNAKKPHTPVKKLDKTCNPKSVATTMSTGALGGGAEGNTGSGKGMASG